MRSRSISLSFVVCAALGLLAGCPGDDKGTGSDTDADTDTTADGGLEPTTGELDPACACIDPVEHTFTCGSGACGLVKPTCVGDSPDGPLDPDCELEIDDAVLTCALDLLIAGEDGVVQWSFSHDGSYSEDGGFVQMFPGRQGLTRTFSRDDSWTSVTAAGVVPLKAADYFQGCKDEVSARAKFDCMIAWSEASPTAQCDAAFQQ